MYALGDDVLRDLGGVLQDGRIGRYQVAYLFGYTRPRQHDRRPRR